MSSQGGRWILGVAMAAALCASGCGPKKEPAAEPAPEAAPTARLVITRAWVLDGGKNRFGPDRTSGDLLFFDDRVELVGPKQGWVVPYTSIERVSLGKLEGDVDSDWIVMDADDPAVGCHIAFRDGKRFGFAPRTPEWYRDVREVLRAAGAAQFTAPAGFTPFNGLESQLSFVYPEGWEIEVLDTVVRDGVNVGGAFRLHWGTRADVVVERRPEVGRKWCSGIPSGELDALAEELAASERFAGGGPGGVPLTVESVAIDHCTGARLTGSGPAREVQVSAVSNQGTLFLFGLRCPGTCSASERDAFDALLGSVRFPDARPDWVD